MNRAVIAIGSNMEPSRNVERAIEGIRRAFKVIDETAPLVTKAVGGPSQDAFLNAAVLIETDMDARELKDWLLATESALGRVRSPRKFDPRTIDLDIVVFNGMVVDEDAYQRDYLGQAVAELCPQALGPGRQF